MQIVPLNKFKIYQIVRDATEGGIFKNFKT